MSEIPTFPVLKLLTDQEVERALARTYSLQEGLNGDDFLRSDLPSNSLLNVCLFGVAFGMSKSPDASDIADILNERTDVNTYEDVNDFLDAVDAIDDKRPDEVIADDATLRAVVAASRDES